MELIISINKQDVFDRVSKVSAYLGQKSSDPDGVPLYGTFATTSYNAEILDDFWNEAGNRLSTIFQPFIKNFISDTAGLEIALGMPGNFVQALMQPIQDGSSSFVTDYITALWISLSDGERAKLYSQKAADTLSDISVKLYTRQAPERVKPVP